MAWAQVKETQRILWLVPTCYGLGTSKKKTNAFYDLCRRPTAWAQVMTGLIFMQPLIVSRSNESKNIWNVMIQNKC